MSNQIVSAGLKDLLSPALKFKLSQMRDKRPLLKTCADAVRSYSEMAFNNASMRPSPWPNKVDESPATLKGNPPKLARSLVTMPPCPDSVEIGSDRPYARAQN